MTNSTRSHRPASRLRPARPALLAGLALLALGAETLGAAALAQTNLRSTFPGRRIGGGTRGECTARLLAHLVPANSVFAPGASRTLGLLEGPVANPRPLLLEFRPLSSGGSADKASSTRVSRDLPAAPAGVTLITLAAGTSASTVWESSYRCGLDGAAAADPLAFVEAAAPPALSLVVSDVTAADKASQAALARLRAACGSAVPRQEVAQAFGLADVINADWPAQLPVRCL
ncbi:MAG: hypothetical protein VKI83_03370 [Synechococcaceae cyanobacterium]|nr:hypothetical protein [Synechococcaceae cyanobacterium]